MIGLLDSNFPRYSEKFDLLHLLNYRVDLHQLTSETKNVKKHKISELCMVTPQNIRFAVYYNLITKHVSIHKVDMDKIKGYGKTYKNNEDGRWLYFTKKQLAIEYANMLHERKNLLEPIYCN